MSNKDLKAICLAWNEMNIIRARNGVPLGSDVSQEHWNDVMCQLEVIVQRETGRGPHCHPLLYEK